MWLPTGVHGHQDTSFTRWLIVLNSHGRRLIHHYHPTMVFTQDKPDQWPIGWQNTKLIEIYDGIIREQEARGFTEKVNYDDNLLTPPV